MGEAVVLDTSPRLTSPWPSWTDEPGEGLVSVPADRVFTRSQVLTAASRCDGPGGRNWQVLTDHQQWSSAPLRLPQEPAAWYQLAAGGGWQCVVADTSHPVAHDIVAARCEGRDGITSAWCGLPFSVPVFCAAATGAGVQALQTMVMAASAEGLPLQRSVIALAAISEGRPPASVRAATTMLQDRVSAVVNVPFDSHIRTHGLAEPTRLKQRTLEAAAELARAVMASLHKTWGEPLPAAPVPAPVAPSGESILVQQSDLT